MVSLRTDGDVSAENQQNQFDQAVAPHLNAAYNLARWLSGSDHDAEDIAQEAAVKAFRFLGSFRGTNSRAWFLTIVRNTAYTWLKRNRPETAVAMDDEELGELEDTKAVPGDAAAISRGDAKTLRAALESLPAPLREAIVLRELEGLSYKEIAETAGVPIGTVMSRLARAREQLQGILRQKGAQQS